MFLYVDEILDKSEQMAEKEVHLHQNCFLLGIGLIMTIYMYTEEI